MNEFIEEYEFLDLKECKLLSKLVRLFEKDGRLLFGSTYSIGNPSYTHTEINEYFSETPKQREILLKNFSQFHQQLFKKLKEILEIKDQPIIMKDFLSPPGFHVFNMADKNTFHMHLDSQYVLFEGFKDVIPDRDTVLTYTILLNTTPMKTGIEYVPHLVTEKEALVSKDFPEYYEKNFKDHKLERIHYVPGKMYLHRGLVPHRLYYDENHPVKRITVQGHLIKYKGEYIAYW